MVSSIVALTFSGETAQFDIEEYIQAAKFPPPDVCKLFP